MKVYLLKDVEQVGFAGELIKVSDGYAKNFLFPRKMGVEITPANEAFYTKKMKEVSNRKTALESKSSMLAEKIKHIKLGLTRKMHDADKLYAAVSPSEIVDLLAQQGIVVSKNQIVFDKSIKTKGWHTITIKLSSKLQPQLSLKVVAAE